MKKVRWFFAVILVIFMVLSFSGAVFANNVGDQVVGSDGFTYEFAGNDLGVYWRSGNSSNFFDTIHIGEGTRSWDWNRVVSNGNGDNGNGDNGNGEIGGGGTGDNGNGDNGVFNGGGFSVNLPKPNPLTPFPLTGMNEGKIPKLGEETPVTLPRTSGVPLGALGLLLLTTGIIVILGKNTLSKEY